MTLPSRLEAYTDTVDKNVVPQILEGVDLVLGMPEPSGERKQSPPRLC